MSSSGSAFGKASATRYAGLLDGVAREALVKGGVWLVRPDGYAAVAAKERGAVEEYLGKIAGR